jgi:hypothetical protein
MVRLWLPRPVRSWWLIDSHGTLIWDYWTHRAARRTADRLNASAVARGTTVRYRVERMP